METAAGWIAPIATSIAAVMVALNAGARITGFGFIVFSVGSIAWAVIGWATGQNNLLWQNLILLAINLFGIWRWLGVRARYDKGADVAAVRSLAASKACGPAFAPNGEKIGEIRELMLETGGGVAYAVLAHGGVGGAGEKLFAVPWTRVTPRDDGVTVDIDRKRLEAENGFDKDAWPAKADGSL